MFCRNCGTQLPDIAKFCKKCGTQVKSSPTPPVEEEPKREATLPVTVVTPQPAPAVEKTPPPKVEVVQTPVIEQAPPVQEIIDPTPVPVKPEPVPITPEPISEPELVPGLISDPVPQPLPEPEPPAVAPVIPETIPATEPPKDEPMQIPPVVADPVPVAATEEMSVEPAVTATEAPAEEPVQTEPDNRCPNCQTEITPEIKFCPECGSVIVHRAATEEKPLESTSHIPAAAQPTNETAPVESSNAHDAVQSVPATPPVSAPKPRTFRTYFNSLSTKAKIILGSVTIVAVILIFCLFGGKYDPALVEANHSYGLSTTVTLDEAIALYNEYLATTQGIEKGAYYDLNLWTCGGIANKNDFTVVEDAERGLIEYQYLNPFSYKVGDSGIDWMLCFVVDSDTGYLMQVFLAFEEAKYSSDNTSVSDETRDLIINRCWALTYALVDGNTDTLNEVMSKVGTWQNGWFTDMTSSKGIMYYYAGCSTEEYFEANN